MEFYFKNILLLMASLMSQFALAEVRTLKSDLKRRSAAQRAAYTASYKAFINNTFSLDSYCQTEGNIEEKKGLNALKK